MVFLGCGVQILGGIVILASISGGSPFGMFLGLCIIIASIIPLTHNQRVQNALQKEQQELGESMYEKSLKLVDIPRETLYITCNDLSMHLWDSADSLNLFLAYWDREHTKQYIQLCQKLKQKVTQDYAPIIKLEKSKIEYFTKTGDVRYETKISGGGSSIGGAVAGGLLAGDAGAVIGSRKGVTSETVEHDTRKTLLSYTGIVLELAHDDFETLKKLIPEKDKEIVDTIAKQAIIDAHTKATPVLTKRNESQPKETSNTIETRLEKLKSLLDNGHITQEEYSAKREKILEEL